MVSQWMNDRLFSSEHIALFGFSTFGITVSVDSSIGDAVLSTHVLVRCVAVTGGVFMMVWVVVVGGQDS